MMITEDEMKGEVSCVHAMKACRGRFSASALNVGELTSRTGLFTPRRKNRGTHSLGRWVGSRDCLGDLEKNVLPLPGFKPRSVQPVAQLL